jgi:hypothetical protein
MYLAYTYFIKNKITNEFYYGSRCKNIDYKRLVLDDFWIHYFTSSKEIKNLRKIYGDNSFEFTILQESEDYDNCYWYEQELIKQNINNPLCLNRQFVDRNSGKKMFSMSGKTHSTESKIKISIGGKGKIMPPISEERKQQISKQFIGTTQSKIHINKRLKTRKENGHYKDRNATITKMSQSAQLRPIKTCHCGKTATASNYKRWHGDNCKS